METPSPVPQPVPRSSPLAEPSPSATTDPQARTRKGLISVIIVNYNAGGYLANAVASIVASPVRHEIIIVDNGSTDDSLSRLSPDEGDRLRILRLGENRGFANACNEGIRLAEGEFLALINPDCRVYPGALATLKAMLEKDPGAGMVGPRVVNPDGSEQRGARRDIPNPWRIFCTTLGLHRLIAVEQCRVVLADHRRAGARGRHHVVEAFKGLDGLLCQGSGVGPIAGIVGRLAAAGLGLRHLHAAAGVLQQLHRGKAHRGPHQIDQTGHEESDARALVSHG